MKNKGALKDKFKLLLSLKLLECEIRELTVYSQECHECYELLKEKLDDLCDFIIDDENTYHWKRWGNHEEIKQCSARLREESVKALCDMEKFQSVSSHDLKMDISDYIDLLSNSVKQEIEEFCIDRHSKVLFIGSGAFPISALTIAKESGAGVLGIDIDAEAVKLAEGMADLADVKTNVTFTHKKLTELEFLEEATHVIVASLVEDKLDILEDLKDLIKPDTKIILRYGNGLKSLFNYSLEKDLSEEWVEKKLNSNGSIYDTVVLEKPKVCSISK